MNFKRNYRMDLQPSFVQELRFAVYSKPERFYMCDTYHYDAVLDRGSLTADTHGCFPEVPLDAENIIRYSFQIHASTKRYLSVIVAARTKFKIWCNHRLIGICKTCSPVLIVPLKKGENHFDVDIICTDQPVRLQIRIEDADSRAAFAAGAKENMELSQSRFYLYLERSCYADQKDPEFMLVPLDQRLFPYHKRLRMLLRDHDSGRVILSRRLRFGKVYRIPWKKLVYDPYAMNHLDLVITCKRTDGQIEQKCRSLYNANFEEYVPELLEKARLTLDETVTSASRRSALMGMIKRTEAEQERTEKYVFAEILKNLISNNTMATEAERYTPGTKRVFFHDALDDSDNFYNITLPKNYDPSKEHPLFMICCTREYGSYGNRFAASEFADMIIADVSVRGVTLGGYIGEGALLRALEHIRSVYRIDPNRIYIGGYSNGASAALAAAQSYPHLFAGVYALSGRAEANKMCNLRNVDTLLISSPEDEFFEHSVRLAHAKETNPEHVKLLTIGLHNHQTIQRVWLNRDVLTKFFSQKRDPYPMRFTYFTDRNRHLQAYWVRLHGIKASAKACKLSVDAGRSMINISVRGAVGFTIELPPFIRREHFSVRINGRETEYKNVTEQQMHFVHGSRGFYRTEHPSLPEHAYKGNGLLEAYMDPLCLVVPENASETVKETADSLSRPQSNGNAGKIAVWYKIYGLSELLDNQQFQDHSLIVVGKDKSPFYKLLDARCPIRTERTGYFYRGEFVKTQYCCMQILQSPWNSARHILYITCNNENLLRRNLFTRCMTLPSYIFGRHPYLNNTALLFDGKNYFAAEMPDAPLCKVGEEDK